MKTMKKTLATLAAAAFLLTGCVPDTDLKIELRTIEGFSGKAHAFGADETHIYLFTDSGTYRFPFNPENRGQSELHQIIKNGQISRIRPHADKPSECAIALYGDRSGNKVYEARGYKIDEPGDWSTFTLAGNGEPFNNNIPDKDATVALTEAQKATLIYRLLAEPLPTCKRYWHKGYEFYMRPLFELCCG